MGKLVLRSALDLGENWYFSDAWFDTSGRRWRYEWPSADFPHMVTMTADALDRTELSPKIRRWIENTITDTVIFDIQDLSYRKYYGEKYQWDKSYEVSNRWARFHFENEHTAMMFRLAFSEHVQEITNHSPKYPGDKEWCELAPEEKYEKTGYRS